MADGGIGEMALADMATTDVGTMAASDAAMSTIPTAIDAAGQLANPFLGSVMAGGAGSLPLELTGADQMLLKSGADALPGMLPGSPVASASQLENSGIGSLTSGGYTPMSQEGINSLLYPNGNNIASASNFGSGIQMASNDSAAAVDSFPPTTQAAGMDKSALGANLTPEFWNSQYGSLNAPTSVGGAAATDPMYSGAAGTEAASSSSAMPTPSEQYSLSQMPTGSSNQQSGVGKLLAWAQANPAQAAAMGLGANYLFNKMATPNYLPGYTPPSAASYGLGRTLAAGYQSVRPMAGGGLTVGAGSVPTQGVAPSDLMQKPNQGAGLDSLAAQYGISPQMVSQARQTYGFSAGGPTEMAVGGKLLSGHGDGMSDSIKANISGNQEARLANSEFVVPADVVSHLGNGSTDAGAKQLYSMMDRVRKARTGRKAQGRQINPQQYMPA